MGVAPGTDGSSGRTALKLYNVLNMLAKAITAGSESGASSA